MTAKEQGLPAVETLTDLYWHITKNALKDGGTFAMACMAALPALDAALASDTGERGVVVDAVSRDEAVELLEEDLADSILTGNVRDNSPYAQAFRKAIAALRAQPAGGGAIGGTEDLSGNGNHRFATPPESGGQGAVLDKSLPAVIWLQVDTDASNDERDEPFTGYLSDLTWCAESIGGLEVQYVRADLAQGGGNER